MAWRPLEGVCTVNVGPFFFISTYFNLFQLLSTPSTKLVLGVVDFAGRCNIIIDRKWVIIYYHNNDKITPLEKGNIMIQIRPVSDLRNKFTEIEKVVSGGEAVYLTKNGYGSMVVLSLENYSKLTDQVEHALDMADYFADSNDKRLTHEEVFNGLREKFNDK